MNFRRRQQVLPRFQMTAMMDVVFLLLCFFVTSSVFSQWEYEVDLTLPSAKSGHSSTRLPGEIILNVSKDGRVTVNGRVLQGEGLSRLLSQVAGYLPDQPVIVRADATTSYADFMKVVDACRLAGIANISLATAQGEDVAAETGDQPPPPMPEQL
ncbi:MAG: biopolymer transporter ExbD [Kiritimatiellae bacterium]|nr:biopolymer transporter ExbD [Kiritimatiellia bacterium]